MGATKPVIVFLLIVMAVILLFGMQFADAEFLHPTSTATQADAARQQATLQQQLNQLALDEARAQSNVAATQAWANQLTTVVDAAVAAARQQADLQIAVRQAQQAAQVEVDYQRQQAQLKLQAQTLQHILEICLTAAAWLTGFVCALSLIVFITVRLLHRLNSKPAVNRPQAGAVENRPPVVNDAWHDADYRRWRIAQARLREQAQRAAPKTGCPVWVVAPPIEEDASANKH